MVTPIAATILKAAVTRDPRLAERVGGAHKVTGLATHALAITPLVPVVAIAIVKAVDTRDTVFGTRVGGARFTAGASAGFRVTILAVTGVADTIGKGLGAVATGCRVIGTRIIAVAIPNARFFVGVLLVSVVAGAVVKVV